MIGITLAILLIAYTFFYIVYGAFLSKNLASSIEYKNGFLVLWNKIQFSLVYPNTKIPHFSAPESKGLYNRLLRLIKVTYVVIILGIIMVFFSDLANY